MRISSGVSVVLFSVIFLLVMSVHSSAQPSKFGYGYFEEKGDTLAYRMLEPDYNPGRKYPLVIFLHGSGERGSDNDAQLKWGAMNFATPENMSRYPAYVIAPQCPNDKSWAPFDERGKDPEATRPMQLVMGLIRKMMEGGRIDTNRIYITGLSMGGFGTFDALQRYPGLFAAAVPVCGGGDITKANKIAKTPVWIFQGAEDQSVAPKYGTDMLRALVQTGAKPGFTQYPEVGHFSWIAAYSDAMMMAWMFRQHK